LKKAKTQESSKTAKCILELHRIVGPSPAMIKFLPSTQLFSKCVYPPIFPNESELKLLRFVYTTNWHFLHNIPVSKRRIKAWRLCGRTEPILQFLNGRLHLLHVFLKLTNYFRLLFEFFRKLVDPKAGAFCFGNSRVA
jgi:hypothetical protein